MEELDIRNYKPYKDYRGLCKFKAFAEKKCRGQKLRRNNNI